MPKFDIPLLVTIEADSEEEAIREATALAEGIGMTEEISISAQPDKLLVRRFYGDRS